MDWVNWLVWGTLDWRVSSSSILNAVALGYQAFTLWRSKRSEGLSLVMLGIFLFMQISYAQFGWQPGQLMMFWGMTASACITVFSIMYAIYLRRQKAAV